ncbi:DUF4142 domain-containing protein [Hamadaea tsunoensis]|uniref:DUF4142 domain-containing protein n=1 Tax=Hamadaea tsunoensis TaxID=53368 RepID=UPI0004151320|nr:DUF4142 domain-containing protein [Hamadaea tsunoensis]
MRTLWTIAAVAAAVLLTGSPAAARLRVEPSAQDRQYLVAAHQSHLAEIAAGRLGEQQGTSAGVRELAATFVHEHADLDVRLSGVAQQLGVRLPAEPTEDQQRVYASLSGASGTAFDRLWVSSRTQAHVLAMNDGETELANGSEQTVKQLAADAAPTLAAHHDALGRLAAQWSPPARVETGSGGFADPRPDLVLMLAAGLGVSIVLTGLWLRRRERRA